MAAEHPLAHLVECSICLEAYSLKQHVPKSLPCGHSFCNICLETIDKGGNLTCPYCKANHVVPVTGVQDFPTNHTITSMMEYSCAVCHSLGQISRCPHCTLQFCGSCLDEHVQSKYKTAVQESLKKALGIKQQLEEVLPDFCRRMTEMMSNCEEFCHESEAVMEKDESLTTLKLIDERAMTLSKKLGELRDYMTVDDPLPAMKMFTSVTSSAYASTPTLVFGKRGSGKGEFYWPCSTTVNQINGIIHIADSKNKRICVYSEDAKYKSSYELGSEPHDICFISHGDVAITCADNKIRIFRSYDISGFVAQMIGKKGKQIGEFDSPSGIATDDDDLLHVCDRNNHRVQVMDKSGSVVRVLGTSGPGKLEDSWSVAVHPQTGQVYVAVRGLRNKVNIYSHDGQYEACIGKEDIPGVRDFWPRYVSCRNDGLMCISDGYNDCLHLLKDGQVTQRIGERGSAPGQFRGPRGTSFTSSGKLIVCDEDNHRLQIFSTGE